MMLHGWCFACVAVRASAHESFVSSGNHENDSSPVHAWRVRQGEEEEEEEEDEEVQS